MNDETILELIKATTKQEAQFKAFADNVINSNTKIEERLIKLETLREQDVKQNEKIEQILCEIQQVKENYKNMDNRMIILETAEDKKAKALIKQVKELVIAAATGAILANIGTIISAIIKH